MTQKEIDRQLREFIYEIRGVCQTPEDYVSVAKRLMAFYNDNHLTAEQMRVFIESGAGEELGMCLPDGY